MSLNRTHAISTYIDQTQPWLYISIYSTVSKDSINVQRMPYSDHANARADLGIAVRICPENHSLSELPICNTIP